MRPDLWALNLASSQCWLMEDLIVSILRVFLFSSFFFILWLKRKYKYWVLEEGTVVIFEPFKLCNYSIKAGYLPQKCI